MSGYTDTYILEANRIQSPEYNDNDNTSIWTNTLSDGVRLNVGDKISVNSAFISDLGAEDSTIEFKGDIIQKEQKFMISEIKDLLEKPGSAVDIENRVKPRPLKGQEIKLVEKTINNVRDTDANFKISYYKTNNGEFMMNLPIWKVPANTINDTSAIEGWQQIRKNNTTANSILSGVPLQVSASHIYQGDYNYDSSNGIRQLIIDNKRYMIYGKPEVFYNYDSGAEIDYFADTYRDQFAGNDFNEFIRISDLLQLGVEVVFSFIKCIWIINIKYNNITTSKKYTNRSDNS